MFNNVTGKGGPQFSVLFLCQNLVFEIVKTHLNQAMKVTPVLATSSLSASSTVPLGAGTTKLLISKPVNGNIERRKNQVSQV